MKRFLLFIALALFTLGIGFISGRTDQQLAKQASHKVLVLGCTTSCNPPGCVLGGIYACDCTTTCTGGGGGGGTITPPGSYGCSATCQCNPDNLGGCWCECPVFGGGSTRDTSQFACEGNPACGWGPTGCYCVAGGGGTGGTGGGGGGGGGGAPTPTPVGCNPAGWGQWGSCFGSPAVKSRQNECGSWETISCTGSIRARAVVVDSASASCATVQGSTAGVPGTTHQFTAGSASQPAAQAQSGASYVTFSGVVGGTYTVSPTVPASYALTRACWSRTFNAPTSGEGLTTTLSVPLESETLTWDLGYRLGTPWVQTGGGNVYAAGAIKSYIAALTTPRSFILDSTGGSPGVAIYGTSYDFDADVVGKGESLVSSTDWLVNQTHASINYYEYFRIKLGGSFPTASFPDLLAVSQPASSPTPYYVVGDMTTSGDWNIPNGETVIFIVNGNLTLGGKVNLTGSGFAAFIVNGNITVSSSVGGLYTSSSPVIEGIYVTSPIGTFKTGTSTVVGKERLVLQGMLVAGGFLLQRDLDSVNANPTTAAELFLYNPRLLISMPDSMRDVPITWAEVAP